MPRLAPVTSRTRRSAIPRFPDQPFYVIDEGLDAREGADLLREGLVVHEGDGNIQLLLDALLDGHDQTDQAQRIEVALAAVQGSLRRLSDRLGPRILAVCLGYPRVHPLQDVLFYRFVRSFRRSPGILP